MPISSKLKPISVNFTLKEHIYDVLRNAILDTNIYDDDVDLRLDERKISEQLGISRTPLREALARLEQEGFVDIQPRKGVYILRKSLEEVLEMIVTWAALESMAARLATEHATDANLRALRKFAMKHSQHAARAEIEEYSEANIQFHQQILELSKCSLLRTTADGLFQHMHAVRRRAMGEADRATRSVREHTMRLHDHVRRTWPKLENLTKVGSETG